MLNTVWLTTKSNEDASGCVMLLGGFDGLHAGHKTLVSRAKEYGRIIGAMTIVGGKSGNSLFTQEERRTVFKNAGVDFLFELPFSEIKGISPAEFAELLEEKFAPCAFVCGDDFRFGYQAQGTPETLASATQVRVETVELLKMDGEKISSTAIKNYLANGETEKANALLGEEFFLLGQVYKDRQVGRTINFPTANIRYPEDKFPIKKGVYETRVCVDGKEYKGITNYGVRPTFDNTDTLTETYLDGFDGDLYNKTLQVRFVRYLRGIRKFESAESLKAQLTEDIRRVRKYD